MRGARPVEVARPAVVSLTLALAACAAPAPGPAPDDAPRWEVQASGTTASLRGVSAVDDRVAWASGSGGTFLRTVDGGRSWRTDTVPGATALDFRDVQAFGADTALLLSAGEPARIYRTVDGGRSWRVTHADDTPGIFFDGMAFADRRRGMAFSDPVGGEWVVIVTGDGGETWRRIPGGLLPTPLPGEAGFAASGRAIAVSPHGHVWIGTGGASVARILHSSEQGRAWTVDTVPIPAGTPSAGVFAVAVSEDGRVMAVGGDYLRERDESPNVAVATFPAGPWTAAAPSRPAGVRQAVAAVPGRRGGVFVAAGPSGSGYTLDAGRSWTAIDTLGLFSVDFTDARTGWGVGPGGRVARFRGVVPEAPASGATR